jgi:hypothetical protein
VGTASGALDTGRCCRQPWREPMAVVSRRGAGHDLVPPVTQRPGPRSPFQRTHPFLQVLLRRGLSYELPLRNPLEVGAELSPRLWDGLDMTGGPADPTMEQTSDDRRCRQRHCIILGGKGQHSPVFFFGKTITSCAFTGASKRNIPGAGVLDRQRDRAGKRKNLPVYPCRGGREALQAPAHSIVLILGQQAFTSCFQRPAGVWHGGC